MKQAMTDRNSVLAPCPFCGGERITVRESAFLDDQRAYTATCEQCYSQAQVANSKGAAVAAWNRRTPAEPVLPDRNSVLEEAALVLAAWRKRDVVSLAAGEMTLQEWRTVYAVLRNREAAIRALRTPAEPASAEEVDEMWRTFGWDKQEGAEPVLPGAEGVGASPTALEITRTSLRHLLRALPPDGDIKWSLHEASVPYGLAIEAAKAALRGEGEKG